MLIEIEEKIFNHDAALAQSPPGEVAAVLAAACTRACVGAVVLGMGCVGNGLLGDLR